MKTVVFYLHPEEKIWVYENIQLQEIKQQEWRLTIDGKHQIYESIYDALNDLAKRGLNPTFHLSDDMDNVPSKCS